MNIIETLGVGLLLTALSGISFIAYKHPTAFARLFSPSFRFITCGVAVFLVYHLLDAVLSSFVIWHMVTEQPEAPLSSIAGQASTLWQALIYLITTAVVYIIFVTYLLLLRQLPDILAESPSK